MAWYDDAPAAGPSFIERAFDAPEDDFALPDAFGAPALPAQAAAESTPFQELVRHWMNERHAPDILPGQEALLGRLLDHVRKQASDVQNLRADPEAYEEEHFRIVLVQTEIERVKFVVRAYVRARLHKIEKYAQYISVTPEAQEKLSRAELDHALRYAKLVQYHFTKSVLDGLPEAQRGMNDNIAFMPPMVPEPDKLRPVFVHALERCPPVRLPNGMPMQMEKGQILLTPFYVIEQLLARGEVELV
ncbi:DNA replication complex GINS protein [Sparassis crispa]|uniref:DNA replication complex GINS protein SLD5 n=1 Tax=Sparassis crispa TaxID=139825 RepID=A0A401GUM2_9APHY|nr:DNA replication complex GINS protein [Sparassis crispa]GBE85883.1 DNA replication complex GINS protein [Sparassis crispa]